MGLLELIGQTTSKGRYGNGARVPVTGTRDGAIYVADYVKAMAMEGKVFIAAHGVATTPINFLAVASYAAGLPQLAIDVPAGTVIIPVSIQVYFETTGGVLAECYAQTSTNVVGAGTSTAVTPLCTRNSGGQTTACTVYGSHTGAGTTPTATREFWRAGHPVAIVAGVPNLYTYHVNEYPPQVIVGAGGLQVFVLCTTAATGYIKASWIELLSTEI